jgi:hypothetical protein
LANIIAVLEKVNAGRVALGALPLPDLPQGTRSNKFDCPIARAFQDALPKVAVGSSLLTLPKRDRAAAFAAAIGGSVESINGHAEIRMPYEFQQFVYEFDNNQLPQYRKDRY